MNPHSLGRGPRAGASVPLTPTAGTNWWLRLTSSGWDRPLVTIEERELARRSRLTSYIILGLIAGDLVLIPVGGGDPTSLVAIIVVGIGLAIAAVLNRNGWIIAAGTLLVLLVCGGIMGSLVASPLGLSLDDLPAFDLLAVTVVIAASILPRAAAFYVAALDILLVCLVFFAKTHASDLQTDIFYYGSYAEGSAVLLARPITLQIILAVVAYLWVRGTDDAIRRADRAEEIAAMEHSIAEQKRQLDVGVQQILETHVRVANGDFTARAPMSQENVLWQIAASLNNLLTRLQRSGQAEYQLRRTDEEIRRLALAIRDAQAGRHPIWPAPTGTSADLIIELLGRATRDPSRPRLPPMGTQASRSMYSSMQSPMPPPFMQPPGQPHMPPSQPAMPPPPWEQWQDDPMPPTGPLPSTSPPREETYQGGASNPWIFPPEGEE
jgi:hypothetical protein